MRVLLVFTSSTQPAMCADLPMWNDTFVEELDQNGPGVTLRTEAAAMGAEHVMNEVGGCRSFPRT